MTSVALRFDVGPEIGLGHKSRMSALAKSLRNLGYSCDFEPTGTPATSEVVVVDSYLYDTNRNDFPDSRKVVAIDELERDLMVDLLIDPTPGSELKMSAGSTHVLSGASFAPIDPGLQNLSTKPITSQVDTFLVATGSKDPEGWGQRIASEIARSTAVDIWLAVGPWGVESGRNKVKTIATSGGLGDWLCNTDIVVTAGGVTMIEAMALGRPTVAFVLHDNQRRAVSGSASVGAVEATQIEKAADVALSLKEDHEKRKFLAAKARELVDGKGSDRIAQRLVTSTHE